MHERYLTAHAPDSVIFPFLHGLEGNNDAQNAFFIGTRGQLMCQEEGSDEEQDDEAEKRRYLRMMALVRVPRFRGLVWVASDEDDVEEYERNVHTQGQLFQEYMDAYQRIAASYEREGRLASLPSPIAVYFGYADSDVDPDEDEDDDSEDDYSTSDEDGYGMNLDIDVDVVGMDVDEEDVGRAVGVNLAEHDEGAHMHPVNTRNPAGTGAGAHARPALSAIDTAGVGKGEFWSFLLSWKILFVFRILSSTIFALFSVLVSRLALPPVLSWRLAPPIRFSPLGRSYRLCHANQTPLFAWTLPHTSCTPLSDAFRRSRSYTYVARSGTRAVAGPPWRKRSLLRRCPPPSSFAPAVARWRFFLVSISCSTHTATQTDTHALRNERSTIKARFSAVAS